MDKRSIFHYFVWIVGNKRQVSCDIDGILNNYPECWLDYLAIRCGTRYASVLEAKMNEPHYKTYKNDYRKSEFKGDLPVEQTGKTLLQELVRKGCSIILATSRPLTDPLYPGLYALTCNWLLKNRIPFDALLFKNDTVDFIDRYPEIELHIEDDLKYAQAVAQKGIPVFLYGKHLKQREQQFAEGITVVDNLLTVLDYVR